MRKVFFVVNFTQIMILIKFLSFLIKVSVNWKIT